MRETSHEGDRERAAESALWFLNAAPKRFQVPRSLWIDAIRRRPPEQRSPRDSESVGKGEITGKTIRRPKPG